MDDASLLALSVGGFFGGMLVISRTLGWVAGLLALLRPPRAAPRPSMRVWPVQLFLHSGPWLLALATAAFVRVSLLPWPALGALCGGFGLALALVGTAVARMAWLRRRGPQAPPLTPERLAEKRRQFLLLMTSAITIGVTAFLSWKCWATLDRAYPVVIAVAIVSAVGGWCYSWILWRAINAPREATEKKRLRQAAREKGAQPFTPTAK